MCGIVGYVGRRQASPILIEGLSQLEYRGYDSAGIAVLGPAGAQVVKEVGRVRDLQAALPKRLAGKVGIGHTRWATHGVPSQANAHPHSSDGQPDPGRAQRHPRQRHAAAGAADRGRRDPDARRPTPRCWPT